MSRASWNLPFVKLHGCANDYLFLEHTEQLERDWREEDRSQLAIAMSERRLGIGSDGIIFAAPSERASVAMWMYNADGTRGAMCGNGLRCLAKYVHDAGRVPSAAFSIETDAGLRSCEILSTEGDLSIVRVDMDRAILDPALIPVRAELGVPTATVSISWNGRDWLGHVVSMGNPHAVFFVEQELSSFDLTGFARVVRETGRFPMDVNVEVVSMEHPRGERSKASLLVRTHERGSGETHACGSGACAVAYVAHSLGYVQKHVEIRLLGGTLDIEVADHLWMTGPAQRVFAGTWDYAR